MHLKALFPRQKLVVLWSAACLRVESYEYAAGLQSVFPRVRLACYAYAFQVPVSLTIGFGIARIKTLGTQERPLIGLAPQLPLAVDVALAAGPYFERKLKASNYGAVSEAISVGMWRTGLFQDHTDAVIDGHLAEALRGEYVLVLPFAPAHGLHASPPETSLASVLLFLVEVREWSACWSDIKFIISSKEDDWMNQYPFRDVLDDLRQSGQILTVTGRRQMGQTYALASKARAVVGKYSSIMEEAFSAEIPIVIHDYGVGNAGRIRGMFPYLPDEVWALDIDELHLRLNFALLDGGVPYREHFSAIRRDLYGDKGHKAQDEIVRVGERILASES